MKTNHTFLALLALLGISGAGTAFMIFKEPPAPQPVATAKPAPTVVQTPPTPLSLPAPETPKTADPKAAAVTESAPAATTVRNGQPDAATAKKAPYQPGPSKFKNAKDPMARKALSGVGADHESEMYWMNAINDPTMPVEERKDLIEDLNEDGISDPRNPSIKDLAVINSRIHLIEQLLPTAMDKANADAFREAHKDLVNMRNRLSQR